MKKSKNFHIAFALISLMMLLSLAVMDRPATATDVKRALPNSAFTKTITVLVYSTGTPHRVGWVFEGDKIDFTAADNDIWILGPGKERKCNANGCLTFPKFGRFPYGALIGRFRTPKGNDAGAWFLVGTSYSLRAPITGDLYLACHDDHYGDNNESISVKVEVTPP